MSNGQRFCVCVRWRWEEKREKKWEESPGPFPLFLTSCRAERQVQRRERARTNRRGQRGGASDFVRCPTFRHGRVNSGFIHPSQGQALLFMQPGLVQAPGMLQRQATSHAQRSLVITGSAAWPCHSHVNTHTSQHFAWTPVINDLNQRKWCFSVCNVNVLKRTTNPQEIVKR